MDLYAENIIDHYRNPRGKFPLHTGCGLGGGLTPLSCHSGRGDGGEGHFHHTESNPACGDEITIGLTIRNGCLHDIYWDGTGCAISQAAMSMLSEELFGKSLEDVAALTKENVLTLLGVPIGPRRLKCALLGLHTLKNAIQKAQGKMMRGWTENVLQNGAPYWSR
ncbi:iron-sulfur cluster assembly scaffold protein [Candidatus Peregrinibacteria bacterium]|nr:iron-sulfur cluster assembly scaffold protein [Candidatus Peregrinibacteria bacterium]